MTAQDLSVDELDQEFVLADEVGEVRSLMRRFLRNQEASTEVVPSTAAPLDRQSWARAATEMGLAGLLVGEDQGGSGLDYRYMDVVMQEAGRILWRAPLLSTGVLVATVLREAPRNTDIDALAALVTSGQYVATVGVPISEMDPPVTVRATGEPDGWHLRGDVDHVLDAPDSDGFLVPACAEGHDEPTLFWVEAGGPAAVDDVPGVDLTRRLGRLRLRRAPARQIVLPDVVALLSRVRDVGRIALAAEAVGSSTRLLEDCIEYSKQRFQFGVPIGSFQAVKHRLADAFMAIENARSLVGHGAWALDREPDEVPVAAAMAAAVASEVHDATCMTSIQVHGGLGVTWEHRTHVHLKRAKTGGRYFGSPREHYTRLADLLEL